jgi:hypothetical protein
VNAVTVPQRLRRQLECPVEGPGDPDYDRTRRVWNGDIDRRPAAVVHPRDDREIAGVLRLAAAEGLEIAVRGGGHSFPGLSVCDGGLVLSLDLMRAVTSDDGRRFRAQGGALLGDLDTAAQARGRVVPSGVVSHTGIAGLTLGGGYGYLARHWGLSCDNLRSVRMITPDGRVVEADDESEPELMFGLRGGGGNFGVASEFCYDSHPLGPVLSGWILHPFDQALDFARFYRDFVASMPDQLFGLLRLRASGQTPFLPEELRGADRAYIGLSLVWCGEAEAGLRLLEPLRAWGQPACDTISSGDFCTLQRSIDSGARHGVGRYERSGYLAALTDEMLQDVLPRLEHVPSNECETSIITLGGRISEVGEQVPVRGAYRVDRSRRPPGAGGLDAGPVGGAEPARHRGRVREPRLRRGGRPGPDALRRAEVRAAGPAQGRLGPGERAAPEPEHRAAVLLAGLVRAAAATP